MRLVKKRGKSVEMVKYYKKRWPSFGEVRGIVAKKSEIDREKKRSDEEE